MTLSGTDRLAYRMLGALAQKSRVLPRIASDLEKARMGIRADAYLCKAWLASGGSALFALILTAGTVLAFQATIGVPAGAYVAIFAVPQLTGLSLYGFMLARPRSIARQRGRAIDGTLSYACNYIAAMSSAGVVPTEIWRSLASQKVYGEVTREAAWIYRDLRVHGRDLINALRRAIARSPSARFQELLQGAITTLTSGGDLTLYFRQKASRYQFEHRLEQKSFIETMGIMAESYVTVAVAAPLFLVVMLSIMVLMGSGEFLILQVLIYVLLPILNLSFMLIIHSMIPEV